MDGECGSSIESLLSKVIMHTITSSIDGRGFSGSDIRSQLVGMIRFVGRFHRSDSSRCTNRVESVSSMRDNRKGSVRRRGGMKA